MRRGRAGRFVREGGFALPLALFTLTLLAVLTAALAGMTTAQVETSRLADWDRKALHAAEAGLEHQIYELKRGRTTPVDGQSLGGAPLEARYRVTRLVSSGPGGMCTEDLPAQKQWWEVTARGELLEGGNVVHSRIVWALVEIRLAQPPAVTVCRFEWR
ncbi:MAG: hypothetical protein QN161_03250 [Armatimonadota bacterium]|nr:hypothetical protein [Armatimonadota bacterium]MDR7608876.1 hypothetical protein [Armatimonadota bacterium]